jgi:hypothetical protein
MFVTGLVSRPLWRLTRTFSHVIPLLFFNAVSEIGLLGLPNVVAYLRQKGYPSTQVYLLDRHRDSADGIETLSGIVKAIQPHLIGFSLMTVACDRVSRLTLELKIPFPHIPII